MSLRTPNEIELYRIDTPMGRGDPENGAFGFRDGLFVIISSGDGWEHVSVSRKSRIPSYEDMTRIKEIFWSDKDCVMQLFVPVRDHINCHPNCLHMWRPINGEEIPRPPSIMVGPG